MLRPFAHPVACCCAKFETGQTFQPTTPSISFVLWSRKRSATMMDPFAQLIVVSVHAHYAWSTKTYGLYPSHDALQVLTMLGVVASVCTQPNVTENAVQRISYTGSPTASILGNLVDNIKQQLPSGKHSHGSLERDLNELIIRAFEFKIFSEVELQNIQRLPKRQTCQFGRV